MVFIVAASSLHHDLDTLTSEKRIAYEEKVFTIPGLSLNNHAKNPQKSFKICGTKKRFR